MTDTYTGKQSMLYVGEVCGSNVFTQHVSRPQRYRCNGCGATYTGEAKS